MFELHKLDCKLSVIGIDVNAFMAEDEQRMLRRSDLSKDEIEVRDTIITSLQGMSTITTVLFPSCISSESEDRQVLSIDGQLTELHALAERLGITDIEVIPESMSAKKPGRPAFNNMLERIHSGEIQGILCWKLDRLARNPVDGGNITWLLQQGIIHEIQTHSQIYRPTDNVLMMAVEFGMANQFILDLSVNTKRGLREKAEKGYPTGQAKIGYENDKTQEEGNRFWIVDEDRFPKVQLMFKKFLTGSYSVADIARYGINDLMLTTFQRRRIGGKLVTKSYVYKILRDPIYAGFFYYNDVRYELNDSLPRVISEQDYWRVQELLGKKGIPRPKGEEQSDGVYNHFMSCGHCNSSVTHDKKNQIICTGCEYKFSCKTQTHCPNCHLAIEDMADPTYRTYDYYRCFKRADRSCPGKSVVEKDIKDQIVCFLQNNFKTSPVLSQWFQSNAEMVASRDLKEKLVRKSSAEKESLSIKKQRAELIRMKSKGQIDDEEFSISSAELKQREKSLQGINLGPAEDITDKIKKIVSLSEMSTFIMSNGLPQDKKEFLGQICSNLILTEKNVNITTLPEIELFINGLNRARAQNPLFEPENILDVSEQNPVFASVINTLLPR